MSARELRSLMDLPVHSQPLPRDGLRLPVEQGEAANILIRGDNLPILQSLHAQLGAPVKCAFIDPPYNTGLDFGNYDDGVSHSDWLSFIVPRIEALHPLLRDDGFLWIAIDDHEAHYLKVECDRILGRQNFISSIVWQKRNVPKTSAKHVSSSHDYILLYAKSIEHASLNHSSLTDEIAAHYAAYPASEAAVWDSWAGQASVPPKSLWLTSEAGDNEEAKSESRALFPNSPFPTPKPERLLHRIISLSTKPEELVLDAFCGSATTAAVAHKMNRRWIAIEQAASTFDLAAARMQKIVDGDDLGGISNPMGWRGGGSFDAYDTTSRQFRRHKSQGDLK